MIEFEWDPAKARSNLRKHGISFEEARTAFYDEAAVQFFDEDGKDEERFILLGLSNKARVLVVVHCERADSEELIRIISARKATKNERKHYLGE